MTVKKEVEVSLSEGWEGTSLVVQWLTIFTPNAGGPGSIPGQGTRYHVLQLRVHMLKLKILHETMKIEDPECKDGRTEKTATTRVYCQVPRRPKQADKR